MSDARVHSLLLEQAQNCRAVVLTHKNTVEALVGPSLLGACSNAQGIVALIALGQVRNALILSRALIEACITARYLLAADDEVRERYMSWTLARQSRSRTVDLGSFSICSSWSGSVSADIEAMFTGPKGGKMTRWSNKSLQQQLKVVAEAGPVDVRPLAFALVHLYEEASEASHGTLYGAVSHLGVLDGANVDDVQHHLRLNSLTMSMICARVLSTTVTDFGAGATAEDAKARMAERDAKILEVVSRFLDGKESAEAET